jgi:hypothetical protein
MADSWKHEQKQTAQANLSAGAGMNSNDICFTVFLQDPHRLSECHQASSQPAVNRRVAPMDGKIMLRLLAETPPA